MEWDWGESAHLRKNCYNNLFCKNATVRSSIKLNKYDLILCIYHFVRKVSQFKALEKQTYSRMFSAAKKGMKNQCIQKCKFNHSAVLINL